MAFNPCQPKLLALVAVILAFPPVFTNFGKSEGLRLSLSLLLFYFIRGLVCFLLVATEANQEQFYALFHTGRIFHFAEIPLSLAAIYAGLQWLPHWTVWPYETLLLWISPVVTIAEGLATLIIIVSSGRGLTNFLEEQQSTILKFFLLILCISIYGTSALIFFSMYYTKQIDSLGVGSFVAVALTLLGVLTLATFVEERGVLTDSALLTLYITYNIWNVTKARHDIQLPHNAKSLLEYLTRSSLYIPSGMAPDSLLNMVKSLFKMFSVELVTGLFIQMSVFLMASRLIEQTSGNDDDIKLERSYTFREWLFNVIWPCFGKCILIVIYTYAWLTHGWAAQVSWYIDSGLWRWINVLFCLALYAKHLFSSAEEDSIRWLSHED